MEFFSREDREAEYFRERTEGRNFLAERAKRDGIFFSREDRGTEFF
jgi:hypothetical protein